MKNDRTGRRDGPWRVTARMLTFGVLGVMAISAVLAQPALSAGPVGGPGAPMSPAPAPKAPTPQAGPAPIVHAPSVPMISTPQIPGAAPGPSANSPQDTTPGGDSAPGIADQGQGGVLTSYVRAPGGQDKGDGSGPVLPSAINPIPGVDVIVRKNPHGSTMHITTNDQGGFTLGKLTPGSFTLDVGDLLPAIDKLQAKQQPGTGSVGQPPIIGILVALLLPAVQQVREASSRADTSSCASCSNILVQHEFRDVEAKGAKLTFTIGKDGYVGTINWGDGTPTEKVNHIITASYQGDANHTVVVNNGGPVAPKNHSYKGTVTLVK